MSPIADFGPLVVETDIDAAVIATLKLWLPTYLAHIEDVRGLPTNTLARPKPESFANTLEDDEFLDHELPAVVVTTAQLQDVTRQGDGFWEGEYGVTVSSIVRGRHPSETRTVGALFSGAVRQILLHQPNELGHISLLPGGVLTAIPDTTNTAGRYLVAGVNVFKIQVDQIIQEAGPLLDGPVYPDPDPVGHPNDPYDPLVTVDHVDVTFQGKPITEE